MTNLFKKIRDKIFGIDKIAFLLKKESEKQIRLIDFNKKELKAFEIVRQYFPDGFLLETSYSLSFQTIQHILNDILIYKPKVILEFGSGLSTLIISNFIKKEQLKVTLISIDDNASWQDSLKDQGAVADFYFFPLVENHSNSFQSNGKWYDISEEHPITKLQFNLVIVDAPKGDTGKLPRFGFISFVKNRLSEDAILYLDDTHRSDEDLISKAFLSETENKMNMVRYYKYSRFSTVQNFNTSPS